MQRTLRLALLALASLAVFVPVATASHDSPVAGADIIGAEPIHDDVAQTLDVDLLLEGNSLRAFSYTMTVYDEGNLATGAVSGQLDTATLPGDGTSTIEFTDLDVSGNGSYTCDDPLTEANEDSGDHTVYLVATVSVGGRTFDVGGPQEVDFCIPPAGQGMD